MCIASCCFLILLDAVRYPRGPTESPLWSAPWKRTRDYMQTEDPLNRQAVSKLRRYSSLFLEGDIRFEGDVMSQRLLRRKDFRQPCRLPPPNRLAGGNAPLKSVVIQIRSTP